MAYKIEYLRRTPQVNWLEEGAAHSKLVIEFFRFVPTAIIPPSGKRTLTEILIANWFAHIHSGLLAAFKAIADLWSAGCVSSSLLGHRYIKVIERSNLQGTWLQLTRFELSPK